MTQNYKENAQVKPLYMADATLLECKARITKLGRSEVNKKPFQWIQLDQTIFHPKGGGQLNDAGTIDGVQVSYVHKELFDKSRLDQFAILHCFAEDTTLSFEEGTEVLLSVDAELRYLSSRMHTAGHVIADTVKMIFPELEGYHGNHDPKDGYVKFKMKAPELVYEKQDIIAKVEPAVALLIAQDLPVTIVTLASGMRAIQIGEHDPMTCGGTHVKHLQEIGAVEIHDVSINKKESVLTVKYRL
jgi:alanyl-tRNA synthetase